MTNRRGVVARISADLFVACLVPLALVAASRSENLAWPIGSLSALLLAVGVAAYLEPSAKLVWTHPLVIMSPEVVALPVVLLACHGHGCAGLAAVLMVVNLFTLLLVGLSYAIFYLKRRIMRSDRD